MMYKRKYVQKRIARERIQILQNLIKENPKGKYAKRYKELIKRIAKKYRIKTFKA